MDATQQAYPLRPFNFDVFHKKTGSFIYGGQVLAVDLEQATAKAEEMHSRCAKAETMVIGTVLPA